MRNLFYVAALWESNSIRQTIRRQNSQIKLKDDDSWQLSLFLQSKKCLKWQVYFCWEGWSLPDQLIYSDILDTHKYHWYHCWLCCTLKQGFKLFFFRIRKVKSKTPFHTATLQSFKGRVCLCDTVLIAYLFPLASVARLLCRFGLKTLPPAAGFIWIQTIFHSQKYTGRLVAAVTKLDPPAACWRTDSWLSERV